MGVADSKLSTSEDNDEITTVVPGPDRTQQFSHPLLAKLKDLTIATPVLNPVPVDSSLKEFLLKRTPSQPQGASLDPTTTIQLLNLYQEWQRESAERINKNQEELGNKIEIVEALATKLSQRLNYSVAVMKKNVTQLEEVDTLKVGLGEMKGKLKEALENYDALCKRINSDGPDFLKGSLRKFSTLNLHSNDSASSSAVVAQNGSTLVKPSFDPSL